MRSATRQQQLDAEKLREIESRAVELVREAGTMALESFRRPLHVEFKNGHQWDPVTNVDRGVENFLRSAITRDFPDHAVLGEEGTEIDLSKHDLAWVLDPIDGTTNFLNGLPLFACSAALLQRGEPVVGAMFLPVAPRPAVYQSRAQENSHPEQASPLIGFTVIHARLGGGAYLDGSPVWATDADKPHPSALTGLPGHHFHLLERSGELRRNPGEMRSLGSICFETAMVAVGALRYAVFRLPMIWDVAAGAMIVREAGGQALSWRDGRWEPLDRFQVMSNPKKRGERSLRYWRAPVLVGGSRVAGFVAQHLRPNQSLRQRIGEMAARMLARR